MVIFCFLKWLLYIFSGAVGLGLVTLLIFSLIDRRIPINEANKTCLVTGASSGIGRALAVQMVKRGWKVIGVARRVELLNELKLQLGADNFISYVCDVSNLEAVHQASDDMKAKGLKPTLFFLNAGVGGREEKGKVSTADHQQKFAVNYFGVVAWVEEWLPMVKQWGGGTFVATSSISAFFTAPWAAAYGASKAALINCFRALRLQYLDDNIGFSVATPGLVDTAFSPGVAGKLPFVHSPDDEARYIIDQTFKGKKQIEPSFFWSTFSRLLWLLPDPLSFKVFWGFISSFVKGKGN